MHCHHGDKRLQPIKHRHYQFLRLATQYHIFLKAHGSDLLLVVKIIFLSLHYQVIIFVFTNHFTNHFQWIPKNNIIIAYVHTKVSFLDSIEFF